MLSPSTGTRHHHAHRHDLHHDRHRGRRHDPRRGRRHDPRRDDLLLHGCENAERQAVVLVQFGVRESDEAGVATQEKQS